MPQKRSMIEHASQHPSVFLVNLHALCEQVGGWLIVRLFHRWKDGPCRAHHCLLPLDQFTDHFIGRGNARVFFDGREFGVSPVRSWRGQSESSDSFRNLIDRRG